MVTVRRAEERRHERHGKLDVWLTFVAAEVPDSLASGFGLMTLLNEYQLQPGASIPCEALEESEIITYVREGTLACEDGTGCSRVVLAGEFQRMTLRRLHPGKETNPSLKDCANIFQFGLGPLAVGLEQRREQRRFSTAERRQGLCVFASIDARRRSLRLNQDVLMFSAILDAGQHVIHALTDRRSAWLHVVSGSVGLGDVVLRCGDGAGITHERAVSFTAREATEVLLVDSANVAPSAPSLAPLGRRGARLDDGPIPRFVS
jgi:redox-sensitive bicupin YhaK (pirin superfamily)